jgi:hypothetical protein
MYRGIIDMGIVYKVTCNETGECYIGSTIQKINGRIGTHINEERSGKYNNACCVVIRRGNWNNKERSDKYNTCSACCVIIRRDNWELHGLELRMKEQEYMNKTDNLVNKWKAYISQEDLIERDKLNKIKYHQMNKEALVKKNGERRKDKYSYTINCECGKSYQNNK